MGDMSFFLMLHDLADAETPLIAGLDSAASPASEGERYSRPLSLTEAGRAVVVGEADHVRLNGVDRWWAGTRLKGRATWRYDRDAIDAHLAASQRGIGRTPMAKTKLQLGRSVAIPESPDKAVLDRVPNPQADTEFVARFTFPEFTSICPVTGQPDFGILVIDYVPDKWLVESKSLKLYLQSFRNHGDLPRGLHRGDRPAGRGPAQAALASDRRLFQSSRRHADRRLLADREHRRRASGSPTRVSRPIADGDSHAEARNGPTSNRWASTQRSPSRRRFLSTSSITLSSRRRSLSPGAAPLPASS